MTIIRDNNKLITNWYRKPTSSNRYINFFSNHPLQHKIGVIFNLVDRALLLSYDRYHSTNIDLIKNILINNCYPLDFINRYIDRRVRHIVRGDGRNISNELRNDCDNSKKRCFITIPYHEYSVNICQVLIKCGFGVVYSVFNGLKCLIKKGKDKIHNLQKTGVVYKLDCSNCDAIYIGQTKRNLTTRIKEHRSDIRKHFSNHSVISAHRSNINHDFNWNNPIILHQEEHTKKREVAEMFFIKRHTNTINLQKDMEGLHDIYDNILTAL
ncbi:hypothetical protein X777_05745 [Ooceraea biroi]|uniref:GIY-YIG domain-containing protein n=1 Tax=Ooceraea biroi TaxID=2015173 RepID=A0A026WEG4_OOCBI|nr:hypothetical protein X777_05745 [Ooceraea biroi]